MEVIPPNRNDQSSGIIKELKSPRRMCFMYVLPGSFLVALQTRKGFDILEHPIDGYGSNQVDYKIIRFTQRTHMQTRKNRI